MPIQNCCLFLQRFFEANRCCSSVVEHFLGKEEVTSSSLVNSSVNQRVAVRRNLFLCRSAKKKAEKAFALRNVTPLSRPESAALDCLCSMQINENRNCLANRYDRQERSIRVDVSICLYRAMLGLPVELHYWDEDAEMAFPSCPDRGRSPSISIVIRSSVDGGAAGASGFSAGGFAVPAFLPHDAHTRAQSIMPRNCLRISPSIRRIFDRAF